MSWGAFKALFGFACRTFVLEKTVCLLPTTYHLPLTTYVLEKTVCSDCTSLKICDGARGEGVRVRETGVKDRGQRQGSTCTYY